MLIEIRWNGWSRWGGGETPVRSSSTQLAHRFWKGAWRTWDHHPSGYPIPQLLQKFPAILRDFPPSTERNMDRGKFLCCSSMFRHFQILCPSACDSNSHTWHPANRSWHIRRISTTSPLKTCGCLPDSPLHAGVPGRRMRTTTRNRPWSLSEETRCRGWFDTMEWRSRKLADTAPRGLEVWVGWDASNLGISKTRLQPDSHQRSNLNQIENYTSIGNKNQYKKVVYQSSGDFPDRAIVARFLFTSHVGICRRLHDPANPHMTGKQESRGSCNRRAILIYQSWELPVMRGFAGSCNRRAILVYQSCGDLPDRATVARFCLPVMGVAGSCNRCAILFTSHARICRRLHDPANPRMTGK